MLTEADALIVGFDFDPHVIGSDVLEHLGLGQTCPGFFLAARAHLAAGDDFDLRTTGWIDLDEAVDIDDFEATTLGQREGSSPLVTGFPAGDVHGDIAVLADLDVARHSCGHQADDDQRSEQRHASVYDSFARHVRAARILTLSGRGAEDRRQLSRNQSRGSRVVHEQRLVRALRRTAAQFGHAFEEKRRQCLSLDAFRIGIRNGAVDRRVNVADRRFRFGHRHDDENAVPGTHPLGGRDDGGGLSRSVDAYIDRQPTRARVKPRQRIRAQADHRHTVRFEQLQRQREIEYRLRSGADDRNGCASKLHQIRGHVEWRAAMHAADPAGTEYANPGPVRDDHRPGNGGCAVLATRDDDRKIASAAFAHGVGRSVREILDLLPREANRDATRQHGDGCRHRTALTHCSLHGECCRRVFRPRQPVRDERGLERDDRPLLV